MKKIIRLTESDLKRLVEKVISEQSNPQSNKVLFDTNSQNILRKWGFKDKNVVPDEFIWKQKGKPTVTVKAVPCKLNNGQYPGMRIYIDGKEFQGGKYNICPDEVWVILGQLLDIPGYENR